MASDTALTDPELGRVTGMALDPDDRLRAMADINSAIVSQQFNSVSRTIFDNWLADVAAPLIAVNQLSR